MAEGSRTAFELWPALDHKSKQSVISAIAVDDAARYIYLGTSDGQLSEHRIQSTVSGVRVSLGARKHVGKKVTSRFLCVHARDGCALRLLQDTEMKMSETHCD